MEKIFYDNWLAKIILFTCDTITLGPFVLTKQKSLSQYTINHECTHARQWIEMAVASGIIIWVMMLVFEISPWWMLLAALFFYIWYGIEYLIRLAIYRNHRKAYKSICFETEARKAEYDSNYLENSHYFSWTKCFKQ